MSDEPASRFDVIALAASAGGLGALTAVLSALPASFGAAVVLVQHLGKRHRSLMAEILDRKTGLEVRQAAEGDRIAPGLVWIAPPDHHLLFNCDGTLSLTQTERVHFVRPSADPLFCSMAECFHGRCVAVVLTGTGSDGEAGVRAVRHEGGTVIAQDEATSDYFGMPGAAIRTGCVDHVLPLGEIGPRLIALVHGGGVA